MARTRKLRKSVGRKQRRIRKRASKRIRGGQYAVNNEWTLCENVDCLQTSGRIYKKDETELGKYIGENYGDGGPQGEIYTESYQFQNGKIYNDTKNWDEAKNIIFKNLYYKEELPKKSYFDKVKTFLKF